MRAVPRPQRPQRLQGLQRFQLYPTTFEASHGYHFSMALLRLPTAALAVALVACGDGPSGPSNNGIPVARVIIVPDSVSLPRSQTMRLEALLVDAAGNTLDGRTITWASSDTLRVKAASDGTITAAEVGSAIVRASSEGKRDSVKVIVTQ